MNEDSRKENVLELHALDFDEDFALIDAAICEYDAVGNAPQRKGESSFQWSPIETSCLGLLARAKDIRVAIWYMRACMARRGMAGLAEGISVLADIMSLPVDEIHPRALPGESPREIHTLHLSWISEPQFLHQLGNACFGATGISLNVFVSGEGSAISDDEGLKVTALEVLKEIQGAFLAIDGLMMLAEQHFDVTDVLQLLDRALARLNVAAVSADVGTGAGEPAPVAAVQRGKIVDGGAEVTTRKGVEIALDRIVEYFRIHEPSHPAPIFLLRVRRMLGASFEEVMAELYAEGGALATQIDRPGAVVR